MKIFGSSLSAVVVRRRAFRAAFRAALRALLSRRLLRPLRRLLGLLLCRRLAVELLAARLLLFRLAQHRVRQLRRRHRGRVHLPPATIREVRAMMMRCCSEGHAVGGEGTAQFWCAALPSLSSLSMLDAAAARSRTTRAHVRQPRYARG